MDSQLTFQYLGIVEEQFAYFPENDEKVKKRPMSASLRFSVVPNKRQLICSVVTDFKNDDHLVFFRCGISCNFSFPEEYWNQYLDETKRYIHFSQPIYNYFMAFTLGTLRGVIHVKAQSYKTDVLLPPLDVNQLTEGQSLNPIPLFIEEE